MKSVFILYLGFIVMCTGCSSLAKRCAQLYPCRDSIVVNTKTIHDSIPIGPWLFTVVDSVPCNPDTIIRYQKYERTITVPERIVKFKYLVQDTCFIRVDAAQADLLKHQNDTLRRQLEKAMAKANKIGPWRFISMFLILLLIASGTYIIRKSLKR